MQRGKRNRLKLHEKAKNASAARAMVSTVHGMLPYIQFTFILEDNTTLEIELPFEEATKFLQQGMAAHASIAPRLRPVNDYIR